MIGYYRWSVILFILPWICTIIAVKTINTKSQGSNACASKLTCHDCIQTPTCVWCMMPGFEGKRCFLPNANTKTSLQCPSEYQYNPFNIQQKIRYKELTKGGYSNVKGLEDEEASIEAERQSSSVTEINSQSTVVSSSSGKQEAVQVYPQEIRLRTRINEVNTIKIQYAQAEDYPVDLYYLMDLSNSMKDDKQKLSELGQLLAESMNNITSNFRLGFGSFVDKVVMPYVSMAPKALTSPCDGCAAPYGYRNHMSLSLNATTFADQVRAAPVSGNLDAPEGGFDAIMQAVVCNEIGWREKSRKLLLFSTDADFHYAGDGKLGGIVKPNDGCCHLENGLYTHSDRQDYPSISQINQKVKENSINVIWAVTEGQINIYSNLTKHIEGSYAAKLSDDSSNIVDLVRDQYNAISSAVRFTDDANNNINITYSSSCLGNGPLQKTDKCEGLKVGNVVEFVVDILVPACPKNRSEWNQSFKIYPVGVNESLTVNLEMICDCECEQGGDKGFELKSKTCSEQGDFTCGICSCYDGSFGEKCECSINDRSLATVKENACRPDNTSTQDCNGRGTCECNQCQCFKRDDPEEEVTGKYCECDNFNCDRGNGELCSGKDHGKCVCRSCECLPGWNGDNCGCSTDESTCYINGDFKNKECSGHGTCECGKCHCIQNGEQRYTGQHCEVCHNCPNKCEELKPCVLCIGYKLGNLTEEECNATCTTLFDYEIVEVVEVDLDHDEIGCHGYDEHDCKYNFAYFQNNTIDRLQVKIQKQRECAPQVFVLGIVLGVIAAVVLIGLALLLLWKLLTTIHDRREFAKFEKERMMAKWDASENPIYKQATSTFKNPMYVASK